MAWNDENSPMSGMMAGRLKNTAGPDNMVAATNDAAVAQELSAVQGAVEDLGKILTELSIRLGPVLAGVGPEEATVRRIQGGDSALCGALYGVDRRLRDQAEFVVGLLRRLEI